MLGHGPNPPMGIGSFVGDMSRPIVKYRKRIRSVVEKHLMGGPKKPHVRWGPVSRRRKGQF